MADLYIDGIVYRKASEVREGDRLDLTGDSICDTRDHDDKDMPPHLMDYEFAVVEDIEREDGPEGPVIVIHTQAGSWGVHADHLFQVDGEQVSEVTK